MLLQLVGKLISISLFVSPLLPSVVHTIRGVDLFNIGMRGDFRSSKILGFNNASVNFKIVDHPGEPLESWIFGKLLFKFPATLAV